jgi:hypothetical protein
VELVHDSSHLKVVAGMQLVHALPLVESEVLLCLVGNHRVSHLEMGRNNSMEAI